MSSVSNSSKTKTLWSSKNNKQELVISLTKLEDTQIQNAVVLHPT